MKIWVLALASAALFAQDVQVLPLVQEGPYWVRATPQVSVIALPRLYVSTSGNVVVRGVDGNRISWRVRQRVRAVSEADAKRSMGVLRVTPVSGLSATRLSVQPGASRIVLTDLQLSVPRQMLSVVLQTQSGGIEAYDIDGDVQASTLSGSIQMDRIGGNVLSASTGGGDIRLGKIGGYVKQCSTGAGSVSIGSSGREIECATAGGEIAVQEAGGPVALSSDGGNILVSKAAGPVRAEASAGMVRLSSVAGPINVATVMGNILVELMTGARMVDSSLVAGAGDITVLIPSNLAMSVMARNSSGGIPRVIQSDFSEIHVNRSNLFRAPMVAQGAINGGGPMLVVDADRGRIYFRKVK